MKNLETKQKIFDKVVKHLFKQKECAINGNVCEYKTADGLKCAVGCLIQYNKLYKFNPNGNVNDLCGHLKYYSEIYPNNTYVKDLHKLIYNKNKLLLALQECHDTETNRDIHNSFILSNLKKTLIGCARVFKIKYKHLKELTKEYND